MHTDEIKRLVDLYFDNELGKNREVLLFTLLSENEGAREYFKHLNIVHAAVQESAEDFPVDLEEKIFHSLEKNSSKTEWFLKRNFFVNAASLGIAALLLLISTYLFFEMKDYRSRIEIVSNQVKTQEQTIELILNNSLPPAEVHTKKVNEIIVNANL
jgi:hypothetical protein